MTSISGKVSSISQIKGSISQGNELVVNKSRSSVSTSAQGVAGSSVNKIAESQDVDISDCDGAFTSI